MPYLPQRKKKSLTKTWQSKESNKLYYSYKWRKFRLNYLKRHPLCIECKNNGLIMKAIIVDHIIPIEKGGSVYDENNLQPLCMVHHAKKSARDKGVGG